MILTVTMNPSVDISYPIETLVMDQVNRCSAPRKTAGGKGLNVTRVTHLMNESVTATGLLGGELGDFIKHQLEEDGIKAEFSPIAGQTRNCIAILHDEGNQTEILEAGPTVSLAELDQFMSLFKIQVEKAQVVTISGSLPKGAPLDFYAMLLEAINKSDIKVVLDSSGSSLKKVLRSANKPYAIKPNLEELQELTGKSLNLDDEALKEILCDDLFSDIPLILVSLGSKGAFVKYSSEFYKAAIPEIAVVNPVGSGDATVAGLAIALKKQDSIETIIKTAMTFGILNTLEKQTGYVKKELFNTYYKKIQVTKLSSF